MQKNKITFKQRLTLDWRSIFFAALLLVMALMLIPLKHSNDGWVYADKLQHIAVFLVLAMIGFMAYPNKLRWVCAGLFVYGGLIELLQQIFTLSRQASLADWLADVVGVTLGLTLYFALQKRLD
jgi:VanZ family protein